MTEADERARFVVHQVDGIRYGVFYFRDKTQTPPFFSKETAKIFFAFYLEEVRRISVEDEPFVCEDILSCNLAEKEDADMTCRVRRIAIHHQVWTPYLNSREAIRV